MTTQERIDPDAAAPGCPACRHGVASVPWQQGSERVWRCARCGLMYRDPANQELGRSADERATLLGYGDFVTHHADRVALEAGKIDRLRRYGQRLGVSLEGARLLDVGAATGTLGLALAEAGWKGQYTGLEPDPALRQAAPPGLDLRPTSLEEAELPDAFFDMVVLSDVLEHLASPVEALQRVRGWLRPGGMVYVEVPDESDLPRRAALRRRLGLYRGLPTHPAHLSLFDRHSLAESLHRARFRGIDVYAASIWGDPRRLRLVVPMPAGLARLAAGLIRLTDLDRALGQGALTAYGRV